MQYNFNEDLEKQKKEYNLQGGEGYFDFEEGPNKIRVLSPGRPQRKHWNPATNKYSICYGAEGKCPGCAVGLSGTVKWIMWVLDRKDDMIKLATRMPFAVIQTIADLQKNDDYKFNEVPMPYDLTITVKDKGKTTVTYSVIPSPKWTPLTAEQQTELDSKTSVEEIYQKQKAKAMQADGIEPDQSQIPLAGTGNMSKPAMPSESGLEPVPYPDDEIDPSKIPF